MMPFNEVIKGDLVDIDKLQEYINHDCLKIEDGKPIIDYEKWDYIQTLGG